MKHTIIMLIAMSLFAVPTVQAETWTTLPVPGDSAKPKEEKAVEVKDTNVVKDEVVVKEEKKKNKGTSDSPFTFQVGTRLSYFSLTDGDSGHKGGTYGSGTFLGTIYALEENQSYLPFKFFGRVFYQKYIGLELAYDTIEAETRATSTGYGVKSDGDISASGPTISIVARYPNESAFTPYVQVGIGLFSGDFDESDHWGLGYQNPSDYAAAGSPSTANNGYHREIDVDSTTATIFGAGCYYMINENILVDLSFQYTSFDLDGTFYGIDADGDILIEQDGTFPMSNYQFRLGLAYQF